MHFEMYKFNYCAAIFICEFEVECIDFTLNQNITSFKLLLCSEFLLWVKLGPPNKPYGKYIKII